MDPEDKIDKYVCEGFDVAKVESTTEGAGDKSDRAAQYAARDHDAVEHMFRRESNLNSVVSSIIKYFVPLVIVLIIILIVAYGRSDFGLRGDAGHVRANEKKQESANAASSFQPADVDMKHEAGGRIILDFTKADLDNIEKATVYFPASYNTGPIEYEAGDHAIPARTAFVFPLEKLLEDIKPMTAVMAPGEELKVVFPVIVEFRINESGSARDRDGGGATRLLYHFKASMKRRVVKERDLLPVIEIKHINFAGELEDVETGPSQVLEKRWTQSKKELTAYWFKKIRITGEEKGRGKNE